MEITFKRIGEIEESKEKAILVTLIKAKGSAPRKPGARMIVFADRIEGTIGGGELEKLAIDNAREFLSKGDVFELKKIELEQTGMKCGGKVTLLFESIASSPRLIIFGAGHVGEALYNFAREVGFSVILCDSRPGILSKEKFANASGLFEGEYNEIIPKLSISNEDYIVILTHGHEKDAQVLIEILKCKDMPKYVGMIGSQTKVDENFSKAKESGIDEERLKKVRAPIGLNVGTETPAEIAISILAEILAIKNNVKEIKPCSG